ncbi:MULTISPECIES: GntR family transcriptional regulator [unclassified Microbacterium]|uniref:GntR family transcriptional regulator n=1 Tax=unclassified Microbacterium TaxID=2609290 RepID=UPI003016806B
MLIRVDSGSDAPLFAQIADAIRADIAAGRRHAGDRLPSARVLAEGLGVNLHTVLRAYQLLRDEGIVQLRRGRGATVTDAAGSLYELGVEIAALVRRSRQHGIAPDTLAALVRGAALRPDASTGG